MKLMIGDELKLRYVGSGFATANECNGHVIKIPNSIFL